MSNQMDNTQPTEERGLTPLLRSAQLRIVLTALVISAVGTGVLSGGVMLAWNSVWVLAIGSVASLFAGGLYVGRRVGEPEPMLGAVLAILYFMIVAGVLFIGTLLEKLPEPLPGLDIGDSTFYFVWPLLMLVGCVLGGIIGGGSWSWKK